MNYESKVVTFNSMDDIELLPNNKFRSSLLKWRIRADQTLESKTGTWQYEDSKLTIPDAGADDAIKDSVTGELLSVRGDTTSAGSGVIFKKKAASKPLSNGQKWTRGNPDSDGWFSIKNTHSGNFLAAGSKTFTTILGTSLLATNMVCSYPIFVIFFSKLR